MKINEEVVQHHDYIRVIGIDELPDIVLSSKALTYASNNKMDLVCVNDKVEVPICKIYDVKKRKFEAKKKQKVIEVKEIKMRPNIDTHDYDVKMRAIQKFFDNGDKVKVTLRFRGREMAHQQLGRDLLIRVRDDTEEIAKVEADPKMEGRQMIMVLAPR